MATESDLVIVTGSTGLIGSRIVKRLAGHHRLARMSRHAGADGPGEGYHVDLSDDESVRDGLAEVAQRQGTGVASVVHLAAYYDFSGEPSPLYRQVTIEGTRRLLTGLREQGFEVEQFLFSSSMLVHAPEPPPGEIEEDDPLDPRWDYPRSKVRTEELIRNERGDIPAVLARIAGVYDDWCHSIPIAHQIQRIFERDPHSYLFPGDPDHGQSFLHADDLVDALEHTVRRRGELPDLCTVLLGEDEVVSYDQLQDRIGQLIYGRDWPTIQIPGPVAQAGAWLESAIPGADPFIKPWMIEFADDNYDLDISRAREELRWEPSHRLWDALPVMIGNLLADPVRWYEENDLDPSTIPAERRQAAGASNR